MLAKLTLGTLALLGLSVGYVAWTLPEYVEDYDDVPRRPYQSLDKPMSPADR